MVQCNGAKEKQAAAKQTFVFLAPLTRKVFCESRTESCEAAAFRVKEIDVLREQNRELRSSGFSSEFTTPKEGKIYEIQNKTASYPYYHNCLTHDSHIPCFLHDRCVSDVCEKRDAGGSF